MGRVLKKVEKEHGKTCGYPSCLWFHMFFMLLWHTCDINIYIYIHIDIELMGDVSGIIMGLCLLKMFKMAQRNLWESVSPIRRF